MPISRRYTPEHPPGETCYFGLDYSYVIPVGLGIDSGTLDIFLNVAPPVNADHDWLVGAIEVRGRAIYARMTGGVAGADYLFKWTATDSAGNVWPRTVLCLCGDTS